MFYPRKKIISRTFKSSGTLIVNTHLVTFYKVNVLSFLSSFFSKPLFGVALISNNYCTGSQL
jgi:hypothetical protein